MGAHWEARCAAADDRHDFQKIYKIHSKLFIGLAGLATDAQTLPGSLSVKGLYLRTGPICVEVSMITGPLQEQEEQRCSAHGDDCFSWQMIESSAHGDDYDGVIFSQLVCDEQEMQPQKLLSLKVGNRSTAFDLKFPVFLESSSASNLVIDLQLSTSNFQFSSKAPQPQIWLPWLQVEFLWRIH